MSSFSCRADFLPASRFAKTVQTSRSADGGKTARHGLQHPDIGLDQATPVVLESVMYVKRDDSEDTDEDDAHRTAFRDLENELTRPDVSGLDPGNEWRGKKSGKRAAHRHLPVKLRLKVEKFHPSVKCGMMTELTAPEKVGYLHVVNDVNRSRGNQLRIIFRTRMFARPDEVRRSSPISIEWSEWSPGWRVKERGVVMANYRVTDETWKLDRQFGAPDAAGNQVSTTCLLFNRWCQFLHLNTVQEAGRSGSDKNEGGESDNEGEDGHASGVHGQELVFLRSLNRKRSDYRDTYGNPHFPRVPSATQDAEAVAKHIFEVKLRELNAAHNYADSYQATHTVSAFSRSTPSAGNKCGGGGEDIVCFDVEETNSEQVPPPVLFEVDHRASAATFSSSKSAAALSVSSQSLGGFGMTDGTPSDFSSDTGRWTGRLTLHPKDIEFTHQPSHRFADGKLLQDTVDLLKKDKDLGLPPMEVYLHNGKYFSRSNRRLYCYKVSYAEAHPDAVLVEGIHFDLKWRGTKHFYRGLSAIAEEKNPGDGTEGCSPDVPALRGGQRECRNCGTRFNSALAYHSHVQQCETGRRKQVECRICHQKFDGLVALLQHKRPCRKKYERQYFPRIFKIRAQPTDTTKTMTIAAGYAGAVNGLEGLMISRLRHLTGVVHIRVVTQGASEASWKGHPIVSSAGNALVEITGQEFPIENCMNLVQMIVDGKEFPVTVPLPDVPPAPPRPIADAVRLLLRAPGKQKTTLLVLKGEELDVVTYAALLDRVKQKLNIRKAGVLLEDDLVGAVPHDDEGFQNYIAARTNIEDARIFVAEEAREPKQV